MSYQVEVTTKALDTIIHPARSLADAQERVRTYAKHGFQAVVVAVFS